MKYSHVKYRFASLLWVSFGSVLGNLPLLAAQEPPTVEQLFAVQTVKVQSVETAKSRTNYGFVKAEDNRIYDIVPRFGGYVEKLFADTRYRKVKKGDVLAQVYSPEVLQAKEDYLNALRYDAKRPNKAMVRSAKAKLRLLGVSETEIDAVAKTKKADTLTSVVAPVSGWIFEKGIVEGSAFNDHTRLFRIVNLDRVWIEAELYQKELPLLPSLTQFHVRATGVDKTFRAKKVLLYPDIDPKAATATLRLEVENAGEQLLPGMYTTIASSAGDKRYLTLPRTAVIRKNGRWYAFVVGEYEGEYEPVEIDVRPLDRDRYEVVSGLAEGDEVVDNALFMMDSDAQINGLY